MSHHKPPSGQNHRSRSTTRNLNNGQRHEQNNLDVSVLKKRNVDLQKRIATQRKVDNTVPKSQRQILDELLVSLKDEAERGLASRERYARIKLKRQAPPPPPLLRSDHFLVSSTPELASEPSSPKEVVPRRAKLRKSLSLSGSRMFFQNFLNTIRISSRRRSRSQDSIFDMGYLDQDQQVVRNAAMKAQQRRGTVVGTANQNSSHVRSLSAEPRNAFEREPESRPGTLNVARRPDKLFLSSPPNSKKRFREKSPVVRTPIYFPEKRHHVVDGHQKKEPVRKKAQEEIDAFEKLISNYLQFSLPSTNL
ncbi:uncharacterized protein LOC132195925 [Neocloeon triangulifer]|uniref:uncharacterized protein LOC132195925 n=1 Tax=Neocloeon triangulifer TaxID=2078957 RepID=UPI00286F0528|nr:uncharacterized protein LOC132195925 [Neocloeon triangulifer]